MKGKPGGSAFERTSRSSRFARFVGLFVLLGLACHPLTVAALCPDGIIDPGEQCDDGGFCVGGSLAGTACTAEADCVDGGACFGGLDDLRVCESDDDCRLGDCRRCRPVGGDGCAANCTFETDILVPLVAGFVESNGMDIAFGTSGLVVFGPFLTVPLPVTGALTLTVGHSRGGVSPVAVRARNVRFDAIPVSTGACACLRGPARLTCGATLLDPDGTFSADCRPNDPDATPCPQNRPCAPLHGAGNAGSGFINCGGPGVAIELNHDCNAAVGAPPFSAVVSTADLEGPDAHLAGNTLLGFTIQPTTVVGFCTGSSPDYGPDGIQCTDDDPPERRGIPVPLLLTTGSAVGAVVNPADQEDVLGPFSIDGRAFACDDTDGSVDISGGVISGVFTACDQPTVSDIVVPISFGFAQVARLPGTIGSTPTPGPDNCCQCLEPLSCIATSQEDCGECSRVPFAACGDDGICRIITPSPTTTPTLSPTPSPSPAPCVGDCNGDGDVTVDEVMVLVGIALGQQVMDLCHRADRNGDGRVAVDDILAAVHAALAGCAGEHPAPSRPIP